MDHLNVTSEIFQYCIAPLVYIVVVVQYCILFSICCCCSFTNSCPTLCNLMDCSMPGFPVLHYLLEFAQIQVH